MTLALLIRALDRAETSLGVVVVLDATRRGARPGSASLLGALRSRLGEDDALAIVTYGADVATLPWSAARELGRSPQPPRRPETGIGEDAMATALLEAVRLVSERPAWSRRAVFLLASAGEGALPPEPARGRIASLAEGLGAAGATLAIFGVGPRGERSTFLRGIADRAGGVFTYAPDEAGVEAALAAQLRSSGAGALGRVRCQVACDAGATLRSAWLACPQLVPAARDGDGAVVLGGLPPEGTVLLIELALEGREESWAPVHVYLEAEAATGQLAVDGSVVLPAGGTPTRDADVARLAAERDIARASAAILESQAATEARRALEALRDLAAQSGDVVRAGALERELATLPDGAAARNASSLWLPAALDAIAAKWRR